MLRSGGASHGPNCSGLLPLPAVCYRTGSLSRHPWPRPPRTPVRCVLRHRKFTNPSAVAAWRRSLQLSLYQSLRVARLSHRHPRASHGARSRPSWPRWGTVLGAPMAHEEHRAKERETREESMMQGCRSIWKWTPHPRWL